MSPHARFAAQRDRLVGRGPKKWARDYRLEADRAPRRGVGLRGGQIPRAQGQRGTNAKVPDLSEKTRTMLLTAVKILAQVVKMRCVARQKSPDRSAAG